MALSKKQQQVVDFLDRNVQMCREFMNDWLLFNQIMSAYPSPGVNKAQLENQFLKIKSKIAREHKVLKDALGADYAIDNNAMNIVSGATNLESIYAQSEVSVKKLQNEWHRAFISINETLGGLEDKKARAEAGEKIFVGALMRPDGGGGGGGMSPTSKNNLIVVILALVILGGLAYFFRDMYITSFKQFFNLR
ncbi:MAG TPA: hypothetical protein PLO62_05875 [Candidatus Hydrogenedentes bacterium]|nr:hypothetical protein [Candidatus Hydrogenedentota bacterium]